MMIRGGLRKKRAHNYAYNHSDVTFEDSRLMLSYETTRQ